MTGMSRVHNFNAGPAVLPVAVIEQVQRDLLELPGAGMSILELSHRSGQFADVLAKTEAGVRGLLGLPEEYRVLFLQGGASLQFSMVPLNLLNNGTADYLITGTWGEKAYKEAQKVGSVRVAANAKDSNFRSVPQTGEMALDEAAAYVHFTTNETIQGVQWQDEPRTGDVPLVADASSDFLSRPLDVRRYGVIYAGAQKNAGPAGVTIVIIRDDLVGQAPPELSLMLNYDTYVKENSLYNTPNTFGIYVVGLVCQWIEHLGGLGGMRDLNEAKAKLLYDVIDADDFYTGHAETASRSRMNITFTLPDAGLEKAFLHEAKAAEMAGLAGHRSVGGVRASIYNACPMESVQALRDFMVEFRRKSG